MQIEITEWVKAQRNTIGSIGKMLDEGAQQGYKRNGKVISQVLVKGSQKTQRTEVSGGQQEQLNTHYTFQGQERKLS